MIRQEAEVVIKINDKEQAKKLEALEKKAAKLREAFNKAFEKGDTEGVKKITQELNRVNKQVQTLKTNAANLQSALKRLDEASPKELKNVIKLINKELSSGRVKRGSAEWNAYCEKLKEVKRELKKVNNEMKDQPSLVDKLKDKFNDWGAAIAASAAAVAAVVAAGKKAVETYADIEQEMANVRKYTGMTKEQVNELNEEFKNIDTRTSREDLNKLAQEAGRLGKTSKEDVLGFVKAANQINVALDELGEGATLTLSKLTNIFGVEDKYGTEESLLKVGSVINELSQNCTASASYLTDFGKRMAGVGAQAGMTLPQIMAFAAVLDSQGQAVEMSATAFSQLIMKLYKDPAKFAKTAGLEVKEFTALLKEDANAAVIAFLEALNKAGDIDSLAPMFEEMGLDGARASSVLAALAGNISTVKEQQREAAKAFEEGISITKEYEVQNNTVQAGLEKARKGFVEMAAALGEQLMPVVSKCISGTSMLMRTMSKIVEFIFANKKAIIVLTAAIVSYKAAQKLRLAVDKMVMGAEKASLAIQKTFKTVLLATAVAYNKVRGNTTRAAAAQALFNATVKANPLGSMAAILTTIISLLLTFKTEMDNDREAMEEARKEQEEYKKSIKDISEATANYAQEELTRVETLYKVATNEKKSREERVAAIETLKKKYPDYFAKLSTEAIMVGKAKSQYDKLTQSILRNAEARAAAEQIKDNAKEIIRLRQEIILQDKKDVKLADEIADVRKGIKDVENAHSSNKVVFNGQYSSTVDHALLGDKRSQEATLLEQYKNNQKERTANKVKIADLTKANQELMKDYGVTEQMLAEASTDATPNISYMGAKVPTETKSEKKEREKAERDAKKAAALEKKQQKEAEAAEKKSEAEAKRRIKEELRDEKAKWEKAEALNLQSYNNQEISQLEYLNNKEKNEHAYLDAVMADLKKNGLEETEQYAAIEKQKEELTQKSLKRIKKVEFDVIDAVYKKESEDNMDSYTDRTINYQEYLAKQKELDTEYYDDKLKVLKDRGLEETDEYATLLTKKAKMLRDYKEISRTFTEEEIEALHNQGTADIEKEYATPGGIYFGNTKAYKEALLREDIDYLKTKQALYLEGSDEWRKIQAEIDERELKDQQEKQQELLEGYNWYIEEWGKASESERAQKELALLEELHAQGYISEEQYQKALRDLKNKYRKEDAANSKAVANEYSDMVTNLYDAWGDFFSNLGKEGSDFWGDFGNAAQQAFAVMSAALSQYTSYANAEKDLELAKIEKKYNAEIEGASKSKRKREALEKEKEAAIAKVKNKANEKAMKMEIAQATAQTAVAAINAYASASKVSWILGPIAAALAVAAGMVQIATIKKQHEAEKLGYYEGGYTGGVDYRRQAGVVHEGEFVANHQAVNNPELKPFLNLIDDAQRNNYVGRLTRADVSKVLGVREGGSVKGEGASLPAHSIRAEQIIGENAGALEKTAKAVSRLNEVLSEGISSYLILDGERGAVSKLRKFNRLTNNARR